jgi:hypothetical protein
MEGDLLATKLKLKIMINELKSARRTRHGKYGNWNWTTSGLFKLLNAMNYPVDKERFLRMNKTMMSFVLVHNVECDAKSGCTCDQVDKDPIVIVNFFSKFFQKLLNSVHGQIEFPFSRDEIANIHQTLKNLTPFLVPQIKLIDLYDIGEAFYEDSLFDDERDEFAEADDREFDREETPEFQERRNYFHTIILNFVRDAFLNPELLPPFLLKKGSGRRMRLSQLDKLLREAEDEKWRKRAEKSSQ